MQTVTYPIAPTVTPRNGTLLDTATAPSTEFANLPDLGLFESFNCMKFLESAGFCADPELEKDLSQSASWVDGFRFAAYGGATCKAIGLDRDHMLAEVRRVFEAGESTAIEKAFMATRFVDDAGLDDRWDAPEDIHPGGAVLPNVAISLLEAHAAANYVGVPTLHLPVGVASLIAHSDSLEQNGKKLFTKLGSKVVSGAGYDFPNTSPTGAAHAAGQRWVYATGEVLIIKGEPVIRQMLEQSNNDVSVLAERPYIAAVDCYTAAIRVIVE